MKPRTAIRQDQQAVDAAADHRARVGAQRRARTRERLLLAAMRAFAMRGAGANVIQEVIAAAGVSQGTFYNYFRGNDQLLRAVTAALSSEMLAGIDAAVAEQSDPAHRLAAALRLYLAVMEGWPQVAHFVAAVATLAEGPNHTVGTRLLPHLEAGRKSGHFRVDSSRVALDLVMGTMLAGVVRISEGEASADYQIDLVATILRGLGVPDATAQRLARQPVVLLSFADGSMMSASVM